MRKVKVLDKDWLFCKGDLPEEIMGKYPENIEGNWKKVTVPHDWAVEGPFDGWNEPLLIAEGNGKIRLEKGNNTGALPYAGTGVYFYKFLLPEENRGKVIRLEFDGVMSHSSIYINGKKVCQNVYGYTSFMADISSFVFFGEKENILSVKAENPLYLTRWYPGAGIYREVRLVTLEKRHFPFQKVVLESSSLDVEKRSALLTAKVEGFSSDELSLQIFYKGKLFAEGENALFLKDLELWSPENPALYQVKIESKSDSVTLSHGFRKIVFDAEKGLFLNDRPFRIKGLCMHHDLGILGAAFDKDVMRWRLRKLKKLHCNSLRMAHNPPDPKLLDLCDEMGFLVLDEAFDVWKTPKTAGDYHKEFDAQSQFDLRSLVRRDRNHPCVFMWSIGNEIRDEILPEGALLAKRLVKICHEEDPSRPVTSAISHQTGEDQGFLHGFAEALDVIGFNYKPFLYEILHKRFPSKPLLATETAAVNTSRGEYYFPVVEMDAKKPFYSSSYAIEHAGWSSSSESMFEALKKNSFMMGEFAWCTFDYLGEPFPFKYPARSSAWGLFDLAGLPKDRAYLYAAQWQEKGEEEILHILPHWDWEEGEKIPVHIFTSGSVVELFLNGKTLGRRKNTGTSRLVWEDVPFEKGVLEALSYDENGKILLKKRRVTPANAAAIGINVEKEKREGKKGCYFFLELFLTDQAGNILEKAEEEFTFHCSSSLALVGVDNGDSCSLLPFKRKNVKLYRGHAMITLLLEEEDKEEIFTVKNEHFYREITIKC